MNRSESKANTRADKIQPPVGHGIFWVSFSLAGLCIAVVLWLIWDGVPVETVGAAPRIVLVVLFFLFVVASLAATEILPWRSRSLRDWRRPKVLGTVGFLLLGALGFITDIAGVFSPPTATAKQADDILLETGNLRQQLAEGGIGRGKVSLIEQHIDGLWGEPGCLVTYTLALDGRLLTIKSQTSVEGQMPYHAELEAQPGISDRLVASVVIPKNELGLQHEFVYQVVGAHEHLTWINKKREILLKLDRCPQR